MVAKSTTFGRGRPILSLAITTGRRPESTCKFSAIYPSGIMPYSAPLVNHTHDHTCSASNTYLLERQILVSVGVDSAEERGGLYKVGRHFIRHIARARYHIFRTRVQCCHARRRRIRRSVSGPVKPRALAISQETKTNAGEWHGIIATSTF